MNTYLNQDQSKIKMFVSIDKAMLGPSYLGNLELDESKSNTLGDNNSAALKDDNRKSEQNFGQTKGKYLK